MRRIRRGDVLASGTAAAGWALAAGAAGAALGLYRRAPMPQAARRVR
ncbi:hypothetical protein [Streptomyces subrutilus]|nr:hypothetical protein [Streptomyces subrutilus]